MAKESKVSLWAVAGTSVVGLVVGSIYGWLTPLWSWVAGLMTDFWTHLGARTPVPYWLIYFLGAVSCGVLLTIVVGLVVARKGNYNRYVRDVFKNVTWRWSYVGGSPGNLWSQCVVCSTQLVYSSDFSRSRRPEHYAYNPGAGLELETSLHCETCGHVMQVSEGRYSDLTATVKRQIHRKLDTGEWKKVVDPDKV